MNYVRTFTCAEWERIERAARERLEPKAAAGFSRHVDSTHHLENETIAVAAELAVYEFLGMGRGPVWRSYGLEGDGGPDAFLANGRTISIKSTRTERGGLIFPAHHPFVEDFAVLVVRCGDRSMRVRGYTGRAAYFARATIVDLHRGCGKQERLDGALLDPFEELVEAQHIALDFDF